MVPMVVILMIILSQITSGQSVYVGKAGSEGKVLRNYLEPSALKKLVEQPVDSIWIVDVISVKAFANGHIPTARSYPAETILDHLREISRDKYLILYCTVGGLAKITAQKLKKSRLQTIHGLGWHFALEMGKRSRSSQINNSLGFCEIIAFQARKHWQRLYLCKHTKLKLP